MKIEVTSRKGINFSVELTEEERKLIKEDLESHLDGIIDLTEANITDLFLKEIKDLL